VLETNRTNSNGARADTSTVLQDVEILAAGQKTEPDPEGKPTSVNVVTLLLKPEDAERVVLASSEGVIHFVLRNGGDRTRLPDAEAARPVEIKPVRSTAKMVPKSKAYLVETLMGDKKIVNSFE
jgi:pilus assembly protein CpaB